MIFKFIVAYTDSDKISSLFLSAASIMSIAVFMFFDTCISAIYFAEEEAGIIYKSSFFVLPNINKSFLSSIYLYLYIYKNKNSLN